MVTGQRKVQLFAMGLPVVTISIGLLPAMLLGTPLDSATGLALVPLPLVIWAVVSIWNTWPSARRMYRAWAVLYVATYAGQIVFMRPGDPGFAACVLFAIALSGVLVVVDRYLGAMLRRNATPDPSLPGVPAWGVGERLPRWQRRVVAVMLFAPMALQELALAVSLLAGHRVSVSAEVRSFGWDLVPAVGAWLVFRAVLIAREMQRPSRRSTFPSARSRGH